MKIKSNTSLSLRKLILSALVVAPLATLPAPLWALPVITGNVTSNSTTTTFTTSPSITPTTLQILDTVTNRLVLKWTEFGSPGSPINAGETITWTLPSASSAVLNIVTGTGATLISGVSGGAPGANLTSNGTIYIVNQNGISLGAGATVSAAGFGLSTVPQNEFYFLANGTLDPSTTALAAVTGVAPLPAAPDVSSAATINVGTTGNVVMSARNVSVSGTITAGTLTLNSNGTAAPAGISVQLAQGPAALTVGTAGIAATGTTDFVPGTGNVVINSNGGNVSLSTASATTILGGRLTINTAGGSVTQGAGAVTLGDAPAASVAGSDPRLDITAGVGTITLANLGASGTNVNRLDVTIPSAGNTVLSLADDIRLQASTITGTLSITSTAEDIASGGASTVSGAVTLSAVGSGKDITFNNAVDTTFGTISSHGSSASSDITLVSGGSITLPNITVFGNLTVTAANNITQVAGSAILQPSTNRRAKFQATTGSITLDNQTGGGVALNDFSRVQLNGAPGGVTLRDLDDVVIHDGTNVTGNVVINAAAVIFGSDADAENTFNGSLTINGSAAGGLTLTSGGTGYTSAPTFTLMDGATVIGSGTTSLGVTAGTTSVPIATAGAGYTSAPTVTIGTGGAAASASLRLDVLPVTVGGTGYAAGNTFIVSGGGSTTPAIVTVATVDGAGAITGLTVTQGGAGFTNLTTVAVTPATVSGTLATFGTGTGSLTAINVTSGGSYTTLPATATLVGGGAATAATTGQPTGSVATLTLTSPPSTFVAVPTVAFSAGTATATAVGGGVYDNSNNVTVIGLTQINTGAPVVIDGGANGSAIGLNHHFGQINVNQGASAAGITLYEQTTLNLGPITTAGKLRAYSSGGDVIDVGPLVAGSAEFGAGTAVAPGNITIDSAGTTITGNIAILDDVSLVTNVPAGGGAVIGTYLARDVTISTAGTVNIAPTISGITGLGILGNMTLSATGTGSDIVFAGAVGVGGLLTLNSADAITANNSDNSILTANVTAGGIVNLRSTENMTINATLTQNTPLNTARFEGDGLTIGSINSDYTGQVWFRSNGSNDITDNVNGMRVFGPVLFDSNRHVTVNNTGHSFGLVSASTRGNNGNITIVESGGLRLGTVTTNGRGNFTATSTTGDIFQDVTLGGIRLENGEIGTGTFSAPLGSITLNDNDRTGDTNKMAIVNATAGGNIVINNPRVGVGSIGQTVLGNVTAGGSLSVDSTTTHTAGVAAASIVNSIDQSSSGRINSFSVTTFVSSGAGAITIGNTGNRMGGVNAVTDTGSITLTESPTLHLLNVRTAGALSATSETGSIIDSAFIVGGTIGTAATPINATFSAPRGGVTLGLGTSNYGTVGFTTGGNVSILDSALNISFATSTIGGTLDVIATAGNINQTGPLTVNGNVTLTANAGGIDFSNTSNMFGGVRFMAGAAGVLIAENTTFNLRGGSVSQGPVQLVTNGDFITSGVGASSITNNLTIQAQGTIIPGAGSLLVTGVFTVFSPSLKDLSALSKSGNLTNRDPINLGSGPFVPPSL